VTLRRVIEIVHLTALGTHLSRGMHLTLSGRLRPWVTLTGKGETKMSSIVRFFLKPARGPASIALIRLAVGLIFFTQGILKYTDPQMGVVRFARIGFPHPFFTAHFVGAFEIVCGLLVLLGLWTRAAAVPLWIVITTAIATTKIPELFRANQGFWFMVSDARTDFAMFCSLLFLIWMGGGALSLDGARSHEPTGMR
jgi:putative oxidoreductase